MKTYTISTLEELEEIIVDELIDITMSSNTHTSEGIKFRVSDVTEDLVYQRYSPKNYIRRAEDGGLLSTASANIDGVTPVSKNTVSVSISQERAGNFPKDDKDYTDDLAETINEGYGDKKQEWNKPSHHIDILNDSFFTGTETEFISRIKQDLRERGF